MDSYQTLVSDLKDILVESSFTSRWVLIEGYHLVGKRIREEKTATTELLQKCAVDLGVSERKLWYAVKFFDTFPELELLPEGKNITWTEVKHKYLETPKETIDKPSHEPNRCPNCGFLL